MLKKTLHDKLVTKVNVVETIVFALKTQYGADKSGLDKKSMMLLKK